MRRTPRPSIRVRLENFIEKMKHYHFCLDIQSMLSRVFYFFLASIPVIVVYKLYDDPGVKQTYVSFSIRLKMITAVKFIWPF